MPPAPGPVGGQQGNTRRRRRASGTNALLALLASDWCGSSPKERRTRRNSGRTLYRSNNLAAMDDVMFNGLMVFIIEMELPESVDAERKPGRRT